MNRTGLYLLLAIILFLCPSVFGAHRNWQRKEIDIRAGKAGQIKAVHYPEGKSVLTRMERKQIKAEKHTGKKSNQPLTAPVPASDKTTGGSLFSYAIDSPPIDGFIPWIAVTTTDERLEELELNAIPENSLIGYPLPDDPETDFVIGLFDTGASSSVMGYEASLTLGVTGEYLTENAITVSGVTGEVDVWVSQPIGLFIDGLDAVDPNGMRMSTSGFMGESNVSIAVGDEPLGVPDLPTAVGSPMAVYYTASFHNDQEITVTHNAVEYTAPHIEIYEQDDPAIPDYPNVIPLELRPLGGVSVSYIPAALGFELEFPPSSPSVIIGNLSQSLYFVHSVDLTDGTYSAFDKDRFMFDTGAQVTVIGSRIAARLGINPAEPEFEVEIVGVTGDISMEPGFYIDTLEIPALGEWIKATNVPVVLIDIASPEGGTLDGIIGMNLFTDCNMVIRGGGLFLQDDPTLEFEFIDRPLYGDIAPTGGDGNVDMLDLAKLAGCWLATPGDANWLNECNIAPIDTPDSIVNLLDFAVLSDQWMN